MEKYVLNNIGAGVRTGMLCILMLMMLWTEMGCKSAAADEAFAVVKEWMGKKIIFPNGIPCSSLGNPVACESAATRYKVLLYTDSTGCVSCDLRIDEWKKIIAESNARNPGLMSYHFYFNPRMGDNLADLFKKENFREKVYIDKADLLNRANKLPRQMVYQCFILNEKDEVVLVGNPTLNENIYKMYMDIIEGNLTPGKKSD